MQMAKAFQFEMNLKRFFVVVLWMKRLQAMDGERGREGEKSRMTKNAN